MTLRFAPAAEEELDAALFWYAGQEPGLEARLWAEVQAALRRVLRAPEQYPRLRGDIRRCLLQTFPYALLYSVRDGVVTVHVFMHGSRRPGYWHGRA